MQPTKTSAHHEAKRTKKESMVVHTNGGHANGDGHEAKQTRKTVLVAGIAVNLLLLGCQENVNIIHNHV